MADIREQDLALKNTIADTDWIRLVTPTGNHRMTVGQFKDLIGYTQAKSDISQLQTDVRGNTSSIATNETNISKIAVQDQTQENLNTFIKPGFYRVASSNVNLPNNDFRYGQLIVIRGGGDSIAQIIFSTLASPQQIAFRAGNPAEVGGVGSWSAWRLINTTAI